MVPGSGCPSPNAGSTAPRMLSLGFTRVLVSFAPAQVWSQRAKGQAVQTSPQGALLIPAKRSPPAAALHRSFFGSGCKERDGHGCVLLLSHCVLCVASALHPPSQDHVWPNGLLECWSGQGMPRETPHCLGRGGCSTTMPHQHPQLCSPQAFLAPLAEVPSSQSPAPASSARALLPCRESRCGQSSPCILHPTSCIPPSHIPHLTSCIPPSLPHLTSCIPLSHIPQPSIPYPMSLHPASLQSHVCSSHIVSDSPKSCIQHPMSTSNPVS